jgi:hypothetical protein
VALPVRIGGRTALAVGRGGGLYAFACSKVYDLREHDEGTKWGPFLRSGGGSGRGVRVDWEKVEAILIVLGTNSRNTGLEAWPIFGNFWGRPFAGVWEKSYIPWWRGREKDKEKEKERGELERRDPYGVSGSWLRVVCFLGELVTTQDGRYLLSLC